MHWFSKVIKFFLSRESASYLNPENGEIRLSNALHNLLARKPVYGYQFTGKHYDCGSKIGFLKAVVEFGLKHPEVKTEFKKYLSEKRSS